MYGLNFKQPNARRAKAGVAAAVPANLVAPSISGTPWAVTQTLTGNVGTWSNSPASYAVQWAADGVDIVGANSLTFTPSNTQATKVLTFKVIATNAVGPSSQATSAATAAVLEYYLIGPVIGDSLTVGRVARDNAIDLNWTGVYQYQSEFKAPTGISANIQPLDTHENTQVSGYLSIVEYYAKLRAAAINGKFVIVHAGIGGSSIYPLGNWGVGQSNNTNAIAKFKAGIVAAIAMFGANYGIETFCCEGSNDANSGSTPTTFETAQKTTFIDDIRSKVPFNGVSGADISTTPIIMADMVNEYISTANRALYQQAIRRNAMNVTGGKLLRCGTGNQLGDNLHLSLTASRSTLSAIAASLMTDTTQPTPTGYWLTGAYSFLAGQKLLMELTASRSMTWLNITGADAASFEIVDISDHPTTGFAGLSSVRQYVRVLSDGTLAAGTFNITVNGKDDAGHALAVPMVFTVAAAYGSVTAAITPVVAYLSAAAAVNDLQNRMRFTGVTLKKGMNQIAITNSGGSGIPTTLKFNGHVATPESGNPASGNGPYLFYLPMAADTTGEVIIGGANTTTPFGGTALLEIVAFEGTTATRFDAKLEPNANNTNPNQLASMTCPAGGKIIGIGTAPGTITATAGNTLFYNTGGWYAGYRTATGQLGVNCSGGFSHASGAAWTPA